MAQRTERSITEDLRLYQKLRRKHPDWKGEDFAIEMGFSANSKRPSNFATFWYLVDKGLLAPKLITVILLHNNHIDPSKSEWKRRFIFDKVIRKGSGLHFRQRPLCYTVEQQEVALQKTLESVKREHPWWIPDDVKTIDECSDRELEFLDWGTFKSHLKKLSQ